MRNVSDQFSLLSIQMAKRLVVRACGRLVLEHGADEAIWLSRLDQGSATDVALDLSSVNDIDARGLGVLAAFAKRALERGMRVSVIAASGVVERLAELTGLNLVLPGEWNERAGLFSCTSPGSRPLAA